MIMKPIASLIHVTDVDSALVWYQRAFPHARRRSVNGVTYLDVNGFAIEIVPADEKVSSGKAGSVTYWSVDDLLVAKSQFEALGATCYRGPMAIEAGLGMCQMADPFGNLIGLRGPYESTS